MGEPAAVQTGRRGGLGDAGDRLLASAARRADAPVGVMTVGPSGMAIDVETGPVRTIESTIADDGTTEMA